MHGTKSGISFAAVYLRRLFFGIHEGHVFFACGVGYSLPDLVWLCLSFAFQFNLSGSR